MTALLTNPGFEEATPDGAVGWIEVAGEGDHLTFPEDQLGGFTVFEGRRAAWLGRATIGYQRLLQRVTVPEMASALNLSFWRCFITQESQPERVFDTLTVSLLDSTGIPLGAPLASYSNLDAGSSCSWEEEEVEAPTAYAGADLQLEFRAVTDKGFLTSFFIDGIALNAVGPCPDGGLP